MIGGTVRGRVLRLDPRRRVATIQLPRLGEGRTFRTAAGLPGEELPPAVVFGYGSAVGRPAGGVSAVRPRDTGAEVDVRVTDDAAWTRLGERGVRVHVGCTFDGSIGPNPTGGRVTRVDID